MSGASALKSGARRWARLLDSPPPRVAVEIAAESVSAARARWTGRGAVAQCTLAPWAVEVLPPGAVAPSLNDTNVLETQPLERALRSVLERVGGLGRDVLLLVPDAAARVALLDFDAIPHRAEELAALVRFRLRKTLPFDAEKAALSVQVLREGAHRWLLAVVAERAHLDEYEDCLERAGAQAAAVWPAGLAALAALPQLDHATLLLRQHSGLLTAGFAWNGAPRFFRVVSQADRLSYDEAYPAVAYFRDFCEEHGAERPAILGYGLPAAFLERLCEECGWAAVAPGTLPQLPAQLSESERAPAAGALLAVAGALANAV